MTRPTSSALVIAAALTLVAAAIAFHGAAQRYEFANLNPRQMTKRDRLTGRVELCTSQGLTEPMLCTPAQ